MLYTESPQSRSLEGLPWDYQCGDYVGQNSYLRKSQNNKDQPDQRWVYIQIFTDSSAHTADFYIRIGFI